MTLMPGLIDCHVHTVASSFNLGGVARQPNVFVMLRALPKQVAAAEPNRIGLRLAADLTDDTDVTT